MARTCFARLPKTKSMASMTLDLPLPLGPTTDEKFCNTPVRSVSTRERLRVSNRRARFRCAFVLGDRDARHLVEGSDTLLSSIRLEVLQHHFLDHEPGALSCRHICLHSLGHRGPRPDLAAQYTRAALVYAILRSEPLAFCSCTEVSKRKGRQGDRNACTTVRCELFVPDSAVFSSATSLCAPAYSQQHMVEQLQRSHKPRTLS